MHFSPCALDPVRNNKTDQSSLLEHIFFEETHSIGLQRHGKKSKGLVDFSKRFSAVSEYQDTCKARYGKFCRISSLKLSFKYRRMFLQQDCFREIPHCYASMDRTGM